MFNLFSKSKKKTTAVGAEKAHKKSVDKKTTSKIAKKEKQRDSGATSKTSSGRSPVTPDQKLHQAAEKLEAVQRKIDSDAAADYTRPPQNREDLIKHALKVHKIQSKLLDNLDEDTRRRLRSLAMEAMAIKPIQRDK